MTVLQPVSIDTGTEHPQSERTRDFYLSVPTKFCISLLLALTWVGVSVWLSLPWLDDLGALIGRPLAIGVITFIAYVPGFMNAFLISTILLDRRPARSIPAHYPSITVLVACYNESANIEHTIRSLAQQTYPGEMTGLVLDAGSTDDSVERAGAAIAGVRLSPGHAIRLVRGARNIGKAGVLTRGLALTDDALVVTVDGDSWVYRDAIANLIERYLADPPGTRAVA